MRGVTGGVVLLILAALVAYGYWSGQLSPFLAQLQALMTRAGGVSPQSANVDAAHRRGERASGGAMGDSLLDLTGYLGQGGAVFAGRPN